MGQTPAGYPARPVDRVPEIMIDFAMQNAPAGVCKCWRLLCQGTRMVMRLLVMPQRCVRHSELLVAVDVGVGVVDPRMSFS